MNAARNPLDPTIGVKLNDELARAGVMVEFHRTHDSETGRDVSVIRFHAGGLIVKTAITYLTDVNQLGLEALEMLRRGL